MLDAKKMIRELAELPTPEERLAYWKEKAAEGRLSKREIDFIISTFEDQADDEAKLLYAVLGYKRCCTVNKLFEQHKLITALYAVYFPEEAVRYFLKLL